MKLDVIHVALGFEERHSVYKALTNITAGEAACKS